jgi:ATP-dependent Clp protease protease subunit
MSESSDKSNEIWVTAFTEEYAQKFREALLAHAKPGHLHPIIIYIDSYGGSVDALAKMIETMDEIPNPLLTVTLGKAMSCGAILFSHGDVRFCGQHSRIMIHEVSSGAIGNVHDIQTDVEEAKRLNEYFMGLLAKNCGHKDYAELRKLIKEQDGRDRYFTAEQAVKFGIADYVGLPKISASVNYEVNLLPLKKVSVNDSKMKKKPTEKIKSKNK